MPGTAVLSRRIAVCATQCPRRALLCYAVAPSCNATLTQFATVLIHRISVLCPAHPSPCVRVRALPMRINAEPCPAVAPQSLAVPSPRCWPLCAPVLCFRMSTLRLTVSVLLNAEHRYAAAALGSSMPLLFAAFLGYAVAMHCAALPLPRISPLGSVLPLRGNAFRRFAYAVQGIAMLMQRVQHHLAVPLDHAAETPLAAVAPLPDAAQKAVLEPLDDGLLRLRVLDERGQLEVAPRAGG